MKETLHIPDKSKLDSYGDAIFGLCGERVLLGVFRHLFGSIQYGQVNCLECLKLHDPKSGDKVYVTLDNLDWVAEKTNSLRSSLHEMLAYPMRYSRLRMVYDGYRPGGEDQPVRGWLLTWQWQEGMSMAQKAYVREVQEQIAAQAERRKK